MNDVLVAVGGEASEAVVVQEAFGAFERLRHRRVGQGGNERRQAGRLLCQMRELTREVGRGRIEDHACRGEEQRAVGLRDVGRAEDEDAPRLVA